MSNHINTQVVVIGSGPGGYSAAFRAADLGKKVVLIERYNNIGGVCLNVGCIPSKALLHAAKIIDEAKYMSQHGIQFGQPVIDLAQLRSWKNSIVTKLTGGLKSLAKKRKVDIITGHATFTSANQLKVNDDLIEFEQAIIAVGSEPVKIPLLPDDPRIMDSTSALELPDNTGNLLILGGGIIGLEMATVYSAIGVKISIVEMLDSLIAGADQDIIAPLYKRLKKQYQHIYTSTKVTQVEAKKDGLWVSFDGQDAPQVPVRFDRILSAVGRKPNSKNICPEKAGIMTNDRDFIPVDRQMRTNIPHIFAIGDVVGQPMLAHKAVPQGRLVAEVIAGKKHYFDPRCIPSVAYTDPEIAWTGVTETQAKTENLNYGKGVFPWAANGRSLTTGRDEGLTKILFDKATNRVIGAGIVGPNAGELIAEIALAIEMGCDAEDIALTIHPHPTLSETIMLATEVFEGTVTDL